MAANVKLFSLTVVSGLRAIKRILRHHADLRASFYFEDDGVHAEHWAVLRATGEELLAADSAGDDVADERVALGQIGSEIHFLPLVSLLYA